jgi:hypothetical protein
MLIGVAISSLVMVVVSSLMYISGRAIKDLYGETRTRSSRMRALDQVRYRLSQAKIGSVVITDSNHQIDFQDPNLGTAVISRFSFNPATQTLSYQADISSGDPSIVASQGPIDVTFQTFASGSIILLSVKSAANISGGDIDEQDGEVEIFLRNPS